MSKKKKRTNNHRKNEITKGIFEILEKESGKSFNYKQIASKLNINDTEGRNILIKRLGQLQAKERIKEIEKGKYKALQNKSIHEGKIEITARGNAYVVVEGLDDDIFISSNKVNRAFDGDRVQVLVKPSRKSNKLEGEVVSVLERKKNNFVGILELKKSFAFVRPTDHKMYTDIFVPIDLIGKAKDGEKVIVEILSWENDADSPTGKVIEVLGLPGLHNTEIHAILAEYGLPYTFPKEVEHDANTLDTSIKESEVSKEGICVMYLHLRSTLKMQKILMTPYLLESCQMEIMRLGYILRMYLTT